MLREDLQADAGFANPASEETRTVRYGWPISKTKTLTAEISTVQSCLTNPVLTHTLDPYLRAFNSFHFPSLLPAHKAGEHSHSTRVQ
jgi:hypothetical protein